MVILSEAKDLRQVRVILRCAQDDWNSFETIARSIITIGALA